MPCRPLWVRYDTAKACKQDGFIAAGSAIATGRAAPRCTGVSPRSERRPRRAAAGEKHVQYLTPVLGYVPFPCGQPLKTAVSVLGSSSCAATCDHLRYLKTPSWLLRGRDEHSG